MSSKAAYNNPLRFDLNAESISSETKRMIADSKRLLDDIGKLPDSQRSFNSVVVPLADSEALFSTESSNVTFPSYVSIDKEIREASSEAQKQVEEFEIESTMREDVYQVLKSVKDKEWDQLDQQAQRLLSRMLRDFERNGLGLPEDKRKRVKELKTRLSQVCIEFQKNIAEDKTELQFSEGQLEGLPSDFVESLKRHEETGKRVVSLKYPELIPVLRYCKVEDTRKQMENANSARCMGSNSKLFEEALVLRQELAELLGFPNIAAYVLDVRMAKNPEQVMKFLNSLREKLTPGGKKELEVLFHLKSQEKKERNESFDGTINAWDFNYYHNLLKEQQYNVNDNEIKDYFPSDFVISGLLQLAQEIFGLSFQEISNPHIWHPEVRLFSVFDADTKEETGQFYLDLYPRDGKYTHAAAFPLVPTFIKSDKSVQKPVSAMVCNFTKSTATKPSLLKHDEVVTLFHEMGHLMHGFASKAKYARFSGTSVERDFVECPSQFMENFCWEVDGLKRISKHWETGASLPDELIKKLIAAKNVSVALMNLRQLFFGFFDMACHMSNSPVNSAELYSKLRQEISLIPNSTGTNGAASFGHLMGGYEAAYYGYLWSQVYSADIFSVFKENGLFSQVVGKNYRKKILEVGGMQDGDEILRNFLGREPSDEPFLKSIGL